MKTSLRLLIAFFLLCTLGFVCIAPDAELESTFKTAFKKYTDAVSKKDITLLKNSMSAGAFMTLKNSVVSMKGDFPKDFFGSQWTSMITNVDLAKGKTLRAESNGNTGVLITFFPKRAGFNPFMPGEEAMSALIVSHYVKEGNTWKFEEFGIEGLNDDDEGPLSSGDLTRISDDKFKASGIVDPIPAEASPPDFDYGASVMINSFGYETEVKLNGTVLGKTSDNLAVRSGVKKGNNTIVITSTSLEQPDIIRVKIKAIKNDNSIVEVFEIELDKAGTVTKTFDVSID